MNIQSLKDFIVDSLGFNTINLSGITLFDLVDKDDLLYQEAIDELIKEQKIVKLTTSTDIYLLPFDQAITLIKE